MPAGRPLQYSSPEQMQAIIDRYFDDCAYNRELSVLLANGKEVERRETITDDYHPTITGLGVVLDLTRKSLLSYEVREEFVNTIKKAKARVESYVEQRLLTGHATGPIFNLKNNFEWKDKTEQEMSGSLDIGMTEEQMDARIAALMAKIGK